MKIYSMTATFGKLENETLSLKPGLNVIHAPNEWGKSTWCAFLVAMLYGFEARARSTQTVLSEKDHYTPWSGAPIAGRIDLNWDGRDITIERKNKGRSVFGDFKAYETDSGLPVPELNAANCGQLLLGVEKSVFLRSAFIRLTDMPVTQDEALRRRLNDLVTTGDESGAADLLEKKLRDLRNRCRYNRTGLLPQNEAEAAALSRKLRELEALEAQSQALRQQQTELEQQLTALENHKTALEYEKSQVNAARVDQAQQAAAQAQENLTAAQAACDGLLSREQAQRNIAALHALQQRITDAQAEAHGLLPPDAPEVPDLFTGMTPEEATQRVEQDAAWHDALRKQKPLLWMIPAVLLLIGAAVFLSLQPQFWYLALIGMAAAAVLLGIAIRGSIRKRRELDSLEARYGSDDVVHWKLLASDYVNLITQYEQDTARYLAVRDATEARLIALRRELEQLCGAHTPQECFALWQDALWKWDALDDARREYHQAQGHAEDMSAMATDAPAPAMPDTLACSAHETDRLLIDTAARLRQLQRNLGQCQGQMAAIGHRSDLEKQLTVLNQRTTQLEETYAALTLALETLEKARSELQRRFAPKIAGRAQELMQRLTAGRYDRLVLTQELALEATAQDESTLRTALWRSDGTMDQLYLALRLAVAGELMPEAPLILDDALVRFDDKRLAEALAVLKEEAAARQVILFTCQSREVQLV